MKPQTMNNTILSTDYQNWKDEIITLIEKAKIQAIVNVNTEMLSLYWKIGCDILQKQEILGWGTQVIVQLSKDLKKNISIRQRLF